MTEEDLPGAPFPFPDTETSWGKRHHGQTVTINDGRSDAFSGNKHDMLFAAVQTTRMPMIVTAPHQSLAYGFAKQPSGIARIASAEGKGEPDVLNKPYGRSELTRKIRVILDRPTGIS